MITIIEVFYLRIIDDTVCYQRKQVNLDHTGGDPDALIHSLIQYKMDISAGKASEAFVVHSTSWRYTPPGKVILTYIAYSDGLEFSRGTGKKLTLKELRKIHISTGQPLIKAGLEKQVVAHAMRHISFLIKTDYAGEFKSAFTPRTRKVFQSLSSALAGRVAF